MLQPVGLYLSHPRRGFSIAETDVGILDRHFPEPWQMALIVMPAKSGSTRAGFFVRRVVGEPAFVCAHEFLLAAPERHPEPVVSVARVVVRSVSTAVASVTNNPYPADALATALQRLRSFLAQEHRHWRLSQWNLAATLTLLLLFVSAGGLWLRARSPSHAVPMHVSDLGTNLRIEWDPAHKAVRTASAASLEIRDGGGGPIAIPITRSGLDNGSVLYVPQSDNIEVRLKLMHGNAMPSESVIYFINPERRVTAPVTAQLAPVPVVPVQKAETARPPAPDPIPQAPRKERVQRDTGDRFRSARVYQLA
jgi:hypothetical protein